MLTFAMANPGYALLMVLTVVCGIYYTVMVCANAWRARAVEREKTRQIEIKGRAREAEANAKLIAAPLPEPSEAVKEKG